MRRFNDPIKLAYSFNTTQLEWKIVTVSRGPTPVRRGFMNAVTDNNDRIYIFGGGFRQVDYPYEHIYNDDMDIFDTTNKIWINGTNGGLLGRDGHTSTFLPDTGEIIYIGGTNANFGLIGITNVRKNINDFFFLKK